MTGCETGTELFVPTGGGRGGSTFVDVIGLTTAVDDGTTLGACIWTPNVVRG